MEKSISSRAVRRRKTYGALKAGMEAILSLFLLNQTGYTHVHLHDNNNNNNNNNNSPYRIIFLAIRISNGNSATTIPLI
jgi:hypothetical protein